MKRIVLTAVFLSAVLFINATSPKIGAGLADIMVEPRTDLASEPLADDFVPLADQFFAGDGSAFTATKWGPSGGPYTLAFTAGNVANFNVPDGTGTGAVGIIISGMVATENFTYGAFSGTLSTGGTTATINVSPGRTLNLGSMNFSTAAGTGFSKTGAGVLFTANGNAYPAGFTLNEGTIVAGGINAMGGGAANTLTINAGTIAGSANRDFSGKYPGGISVAGNFQLGALSTDVPLSSSAANLTFNNNVALGGSSRTVTIGANGTYTLAGIISGLAGTGLTVVNSGSATGVLTLTGVNTYTGPTTITGGILSVSTIGNGGVAGGIGQSTNAAANLVFDGGTLRYTGTNASTNRNFTINSGKTATIDVSINGDLTLTGAAAASNGGLAKTGAGLLNLSGVNLYTGDTMINAGGALALLGSGSIASSQAIEIKGGGFFDVSTLTNPLTLAPGQALRASGTTTPGTIATVAGKGLTTAADSPLQFTAFNGSNAPLTIQGAGIVTVASGNPVTVNTTSALGLGDYTLIAKGSTGTVAGTAPSSLTVGGSGLAAGTAGSLVITGGQLVLRVVAGDSTPPAVSYTNLSNTSSTGNRVLSATISDNVAVATGAVAPRIYFRKNGGAFSSTQCTLTSGNTQSGTYDCTIDNALIGGVAAGDQIGYFVIAQDTSGNLTSSPAGAVATSVNTVTTPPPPNTYTILQTFAGTLSIGTGETITSLTNNGGLFQALNGGTVSGNLTINITSDLTSESGTHALNQLTETGAGGYTIFFQPSGGQRLIEGTSATGLITLNGADRVTFSGLASGPQGLTIRNTSTSGATIRMINDATSNSVLSCIVEGGNTSVGSGVVVIGSGPTTGNDGNSISDSIIRDRTDAVGIPLNLIYIDSSGGAGVNSNTLLSNNQLINFTQTGLFNGVAENSTINGNTVSQTGSRTTQIFAIQLVGSSGTNAISQNIIRDHSTTSTFVGINLQSIAGTATVSRNRIYNIDNSSGSVDVFNGVQLTGNDAGTTVGFENNMVSIVPSILTSQAIHGVLDARTAGTLNMQHNSIYLGESAGTRGADDHNENSAKSAGAAGTWAFRRLSGSTATVSLTSNIFFNNRPPGAQNYAIGDESTGMGTWASDYNLYAGSGSTPSNFFDLNGVAVGFATWQAGPPARDANSIAGIAGSGPFNLSNVFVSPNDLHLSILGNNPAVNNAAAGGVATDFDGQSRPFGAAPDIGADEVQTAPTAAEASIGGRVVTAAGRGISNVRLVVSGGSLAEPRVVMTSAFGYYRIDGLRAGETYVVSASSKRYLFETPVRAVSLGEDALGVDFIGEPR